MLEAIESELQPGVLEPLAAARTDGSRSGHAAEKYDRCMEVLGRNRTPAARARRLARGVHQGLAHRVIGPEREKQAMGDGLPRPSSARIKDQELPQYAVGPAETVLGRIFTARRRRIADYVVLLEQLSRSAKRGDVRPGPAERDLARQVRVAVAVEPLDGDPLQRCPAVGRIPLLAALNRGGREAVWLQQAPADRGSDAIGLLLARKHREIADRE